jgi:hypothetical protein
LGWAAFWATFFTNSSGRLEINTHSATNYTKSQHSNHRFYISYVLLLELIRKRIIMVKIDLRQSSCLGT